MSDSQKANLTPNAANREKSRAALSSLVAALLLTMLKIAAGIATGSLGILAEAAHSALDLIAAGVTFLAVRISSRPADSHHPYGHGKVENLSALAETLLLLLTCGWIAHEAVDRLLNEHEPIRVSIWAFGVMFVSIVVDFNRSRLLSRVAKKHKSQALEADALHFSTDILSSLVVIFGLGAVWAADLATPGSLTHSLLLKADAAAALVVAVIVAVVSLRLGRRAVDTLLDAGNTLRMKEAEAAAAAIPGVLRVSRLRMRESGPESFVDMEIILPAHLTLNRAHEIASQTEEAVRGVLENADVTVHSEPETVHRPDNFFACIRNAAVSHKLDVHAVEVHQAEGKVFVTLHAEVEGGMSLAEAHARADAFEQELGRYDFEVLTHLEPRLNWLKTEATLREPDEAAGCEVEKAVAETLATYPQIGRYSRLRILESDGQRKLSFHCRLPGTLSVRESHDLITRLELQLREKCPGIQSVIIHPEPDEADAPLQRG